MTIDDIIHTLAHHREFPRETLQYCLDHPDEVVPRFLSILASAATGTTRAGNEFEALPLIVHLLADLREQRAYRPLVEFLQSDPDRVESLLGDAITETLPKVLISLSGSDVLPLYELIENAELDEFVRDAAFTAWTYWAAKGQITPDNARTYLLKCLETLQPQADNHVWSAWVEAVAMLGFADLSDAVRRVFNDERIPPMAMKFGDFERDLNASVAATDRETFLASRRMEPFSETIRSLETWHCFSQAYLNPPPEQEWRFEPQESISNPFRHLGRNDPCPCGSGKKYKKCCLH